jgi:hypothetical protein
MGGGGCAIPKMARGGNNPVTREYANYKKAANARFPKFVKPCGTFANELRKAKGISKHMILVPFYFRSPRTEFAACVSRTSETGY